MKKIGFIGAQSMHAVYFGQILDAGVPGLDSASGRLWAPDRPGLTPLRLAEGELAESCASLEALLEASDAVMILLRDGGTHRQLAEACLARGRPVFVDKPFACLPADAEAMLAAAGACGLPLMGGSTLCWLPETQRVAALVPELEEVSIAFVADWNSPYGGWYYYGSHLTDLCAAVAGCGAAGFEARREGAEVEVLVHYAGLRVRLLGSPHRNTLAFGLRYRDGRTEQLDIPDYERCYRLGMERFSLMLRDGKSVHPGRLLFSTRLLHGIVEALRAGASGKAGLAM